MHRLKDALQDRFNSRGENVEIHTPRNLESLLLEFKKRQNLTKVIFSTRYLYANQLEFTTLICHRSLENWLRADHEMMQHSQVY